MNGSVSGNNPAETFTLLVWEKENPENKMEIARSNFDFMNAVLKYEVGRTEFGKV